MKWRALTAGWLALILAIIWLADREGPSALAWVYYIPAGDKLGHFLLLGGLAFLLNVSLGGRRVRLFGRGCLLGSALVLGFAALEEGSQAFIATRTCDWLDLAADILGVWWLGGLCRRWPSLHKGAFHASHPSSH
jgi:VanZ family protein